MSHRLLSVLRDAFGRPTRANYRYLTELSGLKYIMYYWSAKLELM